MPPNWNKPKLFLLYFYESTSIKSIPILNTQIKPLNGVPNNIYIHCILFCGREGVISIIR